MTRGRIISIGGTDAYWGKLHRAHNMSAKMGLVGLSRALAGYTTGQEVFASGGAFPLVRQPWDEYPAEEF